MISSSKVNKTCIEEKRDQKHVVIDYLLMLLPFVGVLRGQIQRGGG